MGLAERRRIALIGEELKKAQSNLEAVIGHSMPLICDLTRFPEVPEILDSYEGYKDYFFPMLERIFQDICKDELGRQAVREKVQSIEMQNTSTSASEGGTMEVGLEDGRLIIRYGFYSYSDRIWGEEPLRRAIENLL